MEEKIARALNVFINLNNNEKVEFLGIVKDFLEYPHSTEQKIQSSVRDSKVLGVDFGPAPGSKCPYCGK